MSSVTSSPFTGPLSTGDPSLPPGEPFIFVSTSTMFSAIFFSLVIQLLQTGVLIDQGFRYFTRCKPDHIIVKAAAILAFSLAMFQTAILIWDSWVIFVKGYGNLEISLVFTWAEIIQPLLTSNMAAILQGFLIYRCCKFMNFKWIVAVPLVLMLLLAYIAGMGDSILVLTFNFNSGVKQGANPKDPTVPYFLTWLFASATLDTIIATTLMVRLLRSKSNVTSPRLNKLLVRVVNSIWETAVPPAVVAILSVAVHLTKGENAFTWDLALIFILGKLYVLSLFITLNFRCDIRAEHGVTVGETGFRLHNVSTPRHGMDRNLRVNIHSLHSEGISSNGSLRVPNLGGKELIDSTLSTTWNGTPDSWNAKVEKNTRT